MHPQSFVLFFLGVLALAAVIVLVGYLSAKKRREQISAFAASRGWRYAEEDPSLAERFDGAPFGHGSARKARNVMYGEHDGRPMAAFDYQYTTSSGSGKNRTTTTHDFSVVALSMEVVMPALSVDPEGVFGRLVGRVLDNDIELESEDFNRAFTVESPHRKFASDVLHPQMMQMLLQWPELGWRFERDSMLVVRSGQHSNEEIDAKLLAMDAIIDQIPEFVWDEVRGR